MQADPDLLLALALSQTAYEEENAAREAEGGEDSAPDPSGSSAPGASGDASGTPVPTPPEPSKPPPQEKKEELPIVGALKRLCKSLATSKEFPSHAHIVPLVVLMDHPSLTSKETGYLVAVLKYTVASLLASNFSRLQKRDDFEHIKSFWLRVLRFALETMAASVAPKSKLTEELPSIHNCCLALIKGICLGETSDMKALAGKIPAIPSFETIPFKEKEEAKQAEKAGNNTDIEPTAEPQTDDFARLLQKMLGAPDSKASLTKSATPAASAKVREEGLPAIGGEHFAERQGAARLADFCVALPATPRSLLTVRTIVDMLLHENFPSSSAWAPHAVRVVEDLLQKDEDAHAAWVAWKCEGKGGDVPPKFILSSTVLRGALDVVKKNGGSGDMEAVEAAVCARLLRTVSTAAYVAMDNPSAETRQKNLEQVEKVEMNVEVVMKALSFAEALLLQPPEAKEVSDSLTFSVEAKGKAVALSKLAPGEILKLGGDLSIQVAAVLVGAYNKCTADDAEEVEAKEEGKSSDPCSTPAPASAPPAPPPMPAKKEQKEEHADVGADWTPCKDDDDDDDFWFEDLFDGPSVPLVKTEETSAVAASVSKGVHGALAAKALEVLCILLGEGASAREVRLVLTLADTQSTTSGVEGTAGDAFVAALKSTLSTLGVNMSDDIETVVLEDSGWSADAWRLDMPFLRLTLVARVLLAKALVADEKDVTLESVWRGAIASMKAALSSEDACELALVHANLLLLLFHALNAEAREQMLLACVDLVSVASADAVNLVMAARVVMFVDYMLHHFSNGSAKIAAVVQSSLMSATPTAPGRMQSDVEALSGPLLQSLEKEEMKNGGSTVSRSCYYLLRDRNDTSAPSADAVAVVTGGPSGADLYTGLMGLLDLSPKRPSRRSSFDLDFLLAAAWRLLAALPVSAAVSRDLCNPASWSKNASASTAHLLRLGVRTMFPGGDGAVELPEGFSVEAHLRGCLDVASKIASSFPQGSVCGHAVSLASDVAVSTLEMALQCLSADANKSLQKKQKKQQQEEAPNAEASMFEWGAAPVEEKKEEKKKEEEAAEETTPKPNVVADGTAAFLKSGDAVLAELLPLIRGHVELIRHQFCADLGRDDNSSSAEEFSKILCSGVPTAGVEEFQKRLEQAMVKVGYSGERVAAALWWSLRELPTDVLAGRFAELSPNAKNIETKCLSHLLRSAEEPRAIPAASSARRVLASLVKCCGAIVDVAKVLAELKEADEKAEKEKEQEKQSGKEEAKEDGGASAEAPKPLAAVIPTAVEVLLDVILDARLDFVKPAAKGLMERLLPSLDDLLTLVDVHKLARLEAVFSTLSAPLVETSAEGKEKATDEGTASPAPSLRCAGYFTAAEPIIMDCARYMSDNLRERPKSVRLFYLGRTKKEGDTGDKLPEDLTLPSGNLGVLLRFLLHSREAKLTAEIVGFLGGLLKDVPAAQADKQRKKDEAAAAVPPPFRAPLAAALSELKEHAIVLLRELLLGIDRADPPALCGVEGTKKATESDTTAAAVQDNSKSGKSGFLLNASDLKAQKGSLRSTGQKAEKHDGSSKKPKSQQGSAEGAEEEQQVTRDPSIPSAPETRAAVATLLRGVLDTEKAEACDLGRLMFDALLASFVEAFVRWPTSADHYFLLLQDVGYQQATLPALIKACLELVRRTAADLNGKGEETDEVQASMADRLRSMPLPLQFLVEVMRVCTATQSDPGYTPADPRFKGASSPKTPANKALPSFPFKVEGALDTDQGDVDDLETDVFLTNVDEDARWGHVDDDDLATPSTVGDIESAEKELCAALCTYTQTGNTFSEQHWYYCYTCGLMFSEGCCSVCAKVCHKGHDLSYSRMSRFFCDCGAGAARTCPCAALKPREYVEGKATAEANAAASAASIGTPEERTPGRTPDFAPGFPAISDEEAAWHVASLRFVSEMRAVVLELLTEDEALPRAVHVLFKALAKESTPECSAPPEEEDALGKDLFSHDKKIVAKEFMVLKGSTASGTFDAKPRSDSRAMQTGAVTRRAVVTSPRGRIAVAEGTQVTVVDGVTLCDIGSSGVDPSALSVLSRSPIPFEPLYVAFNNENEKFLAVAGLRDVHVITLNDAGVASDQLTIEMALEVYQGQVYIVDVAWLPGSQVKLAVVTNHWVKVYDLSRDRISPCRYFTMNGIDSITGATFTRDRQGTPYMFLIGFSGLVFRQAITEDGGDSEYYVTDTVEVDPALRGERGYSIHYSERMRLLFCSYDGRTVAGRLDESWSFMLGAIQLVDPANSEISNLAPITRWTEVQGGPPGIMCGVTQHGSLSVAFRITKDEVHVHSPKTASSAKVEGLSAVSVTKAVRVVSLMEDGSLHSHDLPVEEDEAAPPQTDEAPKKEVVLPAVGVSPMAKMLAQRKVKKDELQLKREEAAKRPVFPVDYFEHCTPISPEVTLEGDILASMTSDQAKARLRNNDEYIASPNKESFTLVFKQHDAARAFVGVRVLLGHSHKQHVPSRLTIFDRTVKTQEATRRWYDIPFTDEEILKADEEFTLRTSASFDADNAPLIDSVEVYAKSKKMLRWREKHRASQTAGPSSDSSPAVPRTEGAAAQAAALKALEAYYTAVPPREDDALRQQWAVELCALLDLDEANHAAVITPAKGALAASQSSRDAYHRLKDKTMLASIRAAISAIPAVDSTPTVVKGTTQQLERWVRVLRKVIVYRAEHFIVEGDGTMEEQASLVPRLCAVFWACVGAGHTFGSLETVVSGLAEIIFAYSVCLSQANKDTSASLDVVRPCFKLMHALLSAEKEGIRAVAGRSLASLARDGLCRTRTRRPLNFGEASVPVDDKTKLALAMEMSQGAEVPQELQGGTGATRDLPLHFFSLLLSRMPELYAAPGGGVSAIPSMQVLYTISTHVLKEPDNEKFKARLDFLVSMLLGNSLSDPSPLVRTPRGEVEVLSFITFTLLLKERDIYRRKKKTPEKEKDLRAEELSFGALSSLASSLRDLHLVAHAKDRVKGLLAKLKSKPSGAEATAASMGALLKADGGDTEQFSLAPFISSSYVKDHPVVFERFEEILLEVVLRLAQCLHEAGEKTEPAQEEDAEALTRDYADAPLADTQFDKEWLDLLCDVVACEQTAFAKTEAKRLLLTVCGSMERYHQVLDMHALSAAVSKIRALGGASEKFSVPLAYEESVELDGALRKLLAVASARPANWQLFARKDGEVVAYILHSAFYLVGDSVNLALSLLTAAFVDIAMIKEAEASQQEEVQDDNPTTPAIAATTSSAIALPEPETKMPRFKSKKKKMKKMVGDGESRWGESVPEQPSVPVTPVKSTAPAGADSSFDHIASVFPPREGGPSPNALPVVGVLLGADGDDDVLRRFINVFLLDARAVAVREEARKFLHWSWHATPLSERNRLTTILASRVPALPSYGANGSAFAELLAFTVGATDSKDSDLLASFLASLIEALKAQNAIVANHPNAHIYSTLQMLVEFDGYYLESDPCLVCNDPEVPFTSSSLDALKTETKFTAREHIVRFSAAHDVKAIMVSISDQRRSRLVRSISVYYNNNNSADMAELRTNRDLWKRTQPIVVQSGSSEARVDFMIPITACNLKIEYEDVQALSTEKLECPRCSRPVHDHHGLCSNCGENAYQCRSCRNINYEDLQAFLCNECGYCKYARFDYSCMVRPSFAADEITSDEEYRKALAVVDQESENSHKRYKQATCLKKPLAGLIRILKGTASSDQDPSSPGLDTPFSSFPTGGDASKVNHNITVLANLYSKQCRSSFDSLQKSTQILLSVRRELVKYLGRNERRAVGEVVDAKERPPNRCFGCAAAFVSHCLGTVEQLAAEASCRDVLVEGGIVEELIRNNIHQGTRTARCDARRVLCALVADNPTATDHLTSLIKTKINFCLANSRCVDVADLVSAEVALLSEVCLLEDTCWEDRLRAAMEIFFRAVNEGGTSPIITETITLPCLRIIGQLCLLDDEESEGMMVEGAPTVQYAEWKAGGVKFTNWAARRVDGAEDEDAGDSNEKKEKKAAKGKEDGEDGEDGSTAPTEEEQKQKESEERAARKKAARELFLVSKYVSKWRKFANLAPLVPPLEAFMETSWVTKLLLCPVSQAVRRKTASLIDSLCLHSEDRALRFLDLASALLSSAGGLGDSAEELFGLYGRLVAATERKLYLVARGFLPQLCELVVQEVARIRSLESNYTTDVSQGFVLKYFVELLVDFVGLPTVRNRFKRDKCIVPVLDAFLSLRGVLVQKTKLTEDAATALSSLMTSMNGESEQDMMDYMAACITALRNHSTGRTPIFIVETLCSIVCPEKEESECLMMLNKTPTQEEFIRGSMTKNPYSSSEVGPLMRDVKRKICQALDLMGLMEDDNGVELLIDGKIIDLGLPVVQVYEKVWKKAGGYSEGSSMPIVYRLQGLDGEATEERVDALDEDEEDEADPEEQYKLTAVMETCGGLQALTDRIAAYEDFDVSREESTLVLKLYYHCCKIKVNRAKAIEIKAVDVLLDKLRMAFPEESQASIAESLLLIIESIVLEANRSAASGGSMTLSIGGEEGLAQMNMFLDKLSSPLVRGNKAIIKTIARILPILTYGKETIMDVLVEYFVPFMDLKKYDASADQLQLLYLDCLVRISENIPGDEKGSALKTTILAKGVVDSAISYLKELFVVPTTEAILTSAPKEWGENTSRSSLPIAIRLLTHLAKSHAATQAKLLEAGILEVMHLLEDVADTEVQVGPMAEDLLEAAILNNDAVAEAVTALRKKTKEEKRRLAMAKRAAVLAKVGMKQEGDIVKGKSTSWMDQMEDSEEDEALTCMICREGRAYKPDDVLGFYCQSTFSSVEGLPGGGRTDGYSTVTLFNVIHFSCHQAAAQNDRKGSHPKEEWEGAALRNSHAPCNTVYPMRGPKEADESYRSCIDRHWSNLSNAGRCDASRVRVLCHDLRSLLLRYSEEQAFSAQSGGRESNIKLIPYMVEQAVFLMEQDATQRRQHEKALSSWLSQSTDKWLASCRSAENVIYHMVVSVFLLTVEEWSAHRLSFLHRALVWAYARYQAMVGMKEPEGDGPPSVFAQCRTGVIFFGLIDQMHGIFKKPSGLKSAPRVPGKKVGFVHDPDEEWIVAMGTSKSGGDDVKLIDSCLEMLEVYKDEYIPVEDFSEFFDVLEVLGDVLGEASSADEFVSAILKKAKIL